MKKKNNEIKYSEYQQKFIDFVEHGVGNAVVSARAGSGKTFLLIEAIKRIPCKQKCIFLAFNKAISDELTMKLKDRPNATVRTSHSLGFMMLRRNFGNEIEVNDYKYRTYIKSNISELTSASEQITTKKQLRDYLDSILQLINFARLNYCQTVKEIDAIAFKYSIPIQYDECEVVLKSMKWGKENTNVIDYIDMVWLPVEMNLKPLGLQYDWVFVDECFPYNQQIITSEGKTKIGKLYKLFKSDKRLTLPLIKSYNEKEKCYEWKKIIGVSKHEQRDIVEVACGTKRKFKCTANEKFLTPNGYRYLSELKEGDILCCSTTEQPYHLLLNEEQKEIFVSQVIGDGSIQKISKNVYKCKIIHCEKQKEYIEWKNLMLGDNKISFIEKNGISKKPAYTFNTKGICIDENILNCDNVINNLTIKQLAINYQDNGYLNGKVSRLYSCVDDYKKIELLRQRICKLINVDENLIKVCEDKSRLSGKTYYYLQFNTESTYSLHKNICKFVNESLKYKIIETFHNEVNTYKWDYTPAPTGGIVITSIKQLNIKEDVYDIEVEDNHNFIISSNGYINKNSKEGLKNGIIVHNCQDQSIVSTELFKKCFKRGTRFVAVGDQKQAINCFAGASDEAFDNICNIPNTQMFELPISYRCDKKIIKFANTIVPDIVAREDAGEGEILHDCRTSDLQEGDMVLCRSKAPLVKLYSKLLQKKVNCYIKGQDIGSKLIKIIEPIDKVELNSNLNKDGVFVRLYEKLFNDRNKLMQKRGMDFDDASTSSSIMEQYDNINTLITLSKNINNKYELIEHINSIFKEEEQGICLSTVHKSKGLEADNVYILCHSTMPSKLAQLDWEKKQEENLLYVAYTRAKHKLGFISEKEIPPCGSSQEPMDIINDLMYIENKICRILGTEPTVRMNSVDIAKFNLKNATEVKEIPLDIEVHTIDPKTEDFDVNFLEHLKRIMENHMDEYYDEDEYL